MSKFIPVLNTKYNNWIVIDDIIHKTKNGITQFHVQCNCGFTKYVNASDLIKGRSRQCISCGQYNGIKNLSQSYIASVKKGAKSRDIEYNLTIEYIYNLLIQQQFKCNLSGIEIKTVKKYYGIDRLEQTASLDRIDSDIGYIEGNVQWIHKDINIMKNDFDEKYFIAICKKIGEYGK